MSGRMTNQGEPAAAPPLAGIRVCDLTRVLAGPFCTMVLADLGAEVIKIEAPSNPDYTRSIPPFAGEVSHYFLAVNRNKKSLALDLKSPRGRAVGLSLALASDVVVENFRPGVLARLGLDYATLRARKPEIIVCSLSGFGQAGELAAQMDAFWRNFCRAAGRADLIDDARLGTVAGRFEHYEEVEHIVSEVLRTKPLAEWRRLLDEADVPNAPVLSVGEALEQPHVLERGLIREIDQPGAGRVRVPGSTVKFLGGADAIEIGHAPALGEHTRDVLRDVVGLGE